MGNHEIGDQILSGMDQEIADRRSTARTTTDMDPRKALDTVNGKLALGKGYYIWTTMGDPPLWLIRVPRNDEEAEAWMKDEQVELIHVCDPLKFYEAMMKEEKEALVHHSGYVKEEDCHRCKRPCPPEILKAARTQRSLFEVAKKVS